MPEFTSAKQIGDVVKGEDTRNRRTRDQGIIAAGAGVLDIGTVLGKATIAAPGAASAAGAAVAGNTGDGTITMANPATGAGVKLGVYRATLIEPAANGGTFLVTDPDGVEIGRAVVGAAFTGVVKFTIADGATDFVAGDAFTITVAAGTGKFAGVDLAAATGLATAAAILLEKVDATSADQKALLMVRGPAEVGQAGLIYGASVNDATKRANVHAQLAALGIVVLESA